MMESKTIRRKRERENDETKKTSKAVNWQHHTVSDTTEWSVIAAAAQQHDTLESCSWKIPRTNCSIVARLRSIYCCRGGVVVTVIAGAVHSKVGVGGMIDESRIFYNPQRRIVKIFGNCTCSSQSSLAGFTVDKFESLSCLKLEFKIAWPWMLTNTLPS